MPSFRKELEWIFWEAPYELYQIDEKKALILREKALKSVLYGLCALIKPSVVGVWDVTEREMAIIESVRNKFPKTRKFDIDLSEDWRLWSFCVFGKHPEHPAERYWNRASICVLGAEKMPEERYPFKRIVSATKGFGLFWRTRQKEDWTDVREEKDA